MMCKLMRYRIQSSPTSKTNWCLGLMMIKRYHQKRASYVKILSKINK